MWKQPKEGLGTAPSARTTVETGEVALTGARRSAKMDPIIQSG